MALKQHLDDQVRFDQQVENSRNYVLPFIHEVLPVDSDLKVLEIGTGEGGVLVPFLEKGCRCVGVDLAENRIELAKYFLEKFVENRQVRLACKNVYDTDFLNEYKNHFDIIILKDVIEHVPDQEKFMPYLNAFLSEKGVIFFGFPPWYMPFGGHQQVCKNKWLSKLPWYHLLPKPIYKSILKMGGEPQGAIDELLEVKDTGISIERFERIAKNNNFPILKKQHFLINPIYKYKFGWSAKKQYAFIESLPFFRNFATTCAYYILGKSH